MKPEKPNLKDPRINTDFGSRPYKSLETILVQLMINVCHDVYNFCRSKFKNPFLKKNYMKPNLKTPRFSTNLSQPFLFLNAPKSGFRRNTVCHHMSLPVHHIITNTLINKYDKETQAHLKNH